MSHSRTPEQGKQCFGTKRETFRRGDAADGEVAPPRSAVYPGFWPPPISTGCIANAEADKDPLNCFPPRGKLI